MFSHNSRHREFHSVSKSTNRFRYINITLSDSGHCNLKQTHSLKCESLALYVDIIIGILELQGWTDVMDPDSDPDLSLFIAVMTLVIGVMPLFIGIMTLIRGLVLRLMASLIVHAPQIVYITGMWSELK